MWNAREAAAVRKPEATRSQIMELDRLSGRRGLAAGAFLLAAAAGAGLFLASRRRELQGEESTEEEVEAHPS